MPLVAVIMKMLLLILFTVVFNLFIGTDASCEIPLAPEHGTLHILGDSKVNSIALYSCKDGWKLVGASAAKCHETGQWTSPAPKCVTIKDSSILTTKTAFAPTTTPVGSTLPERKVTSVEDEELDPSTTPSLPQENNCSCTYNSHDRKLSAEINGLGLWNGDKVRKGDKMTLRCYDPAKHLVLRNATSLSGTLALTCDVCRIWEDSDLPSCEDVGSGSCVLSAIPNGDVGYMETRRVSRYKLEERFVEFQVGKIFKDGETAIFRCRDGFEPVENMQSPESWRRSGEVVTCKDGQWSQSLECKPESCYGEPPPVDNGYPVVNNRSHGFGIYYICDNYYVKAGKDDVKCSYGQWISKTPKCIDGRCYASQLNHPGLEKPPVDFIEHGKNYTATCIKGLKAPIEGIKVSCNAGKWNVSAAICVKESCDGEPPSMDNGYPVVNNRSHGYAIYYRCNKYYVKAAKGDVKCSYGQWTGHTPTCIDGRCYVSQLNHPGLVKPQVDYIENGKEYPATCGKGFTALNQWMKMSCNDGKWNIPAVFCTKVDEITTPASPTAEERVSRPPENCFCTFNPRSEHLVAVVNGQSLEHGDSVKKSDSVLLSCTEPRLHLLWPNGMRTLDVNMTCEVCQAWGSNDLPSCEPTHPGDSFIVLNKDMEVQPGGAVESHLGRNLKIECINWNANYPDWTTPMMLMVSHNLQRVDAQYTFYQSFIHIHNFGQQHAGSYECSTRTPRLRFLRPTKLDLITGISVPEKVTLNPPASKESKSEEECACIYTGNWRLIALLNGERIWRGTNITKGENIQLGCVNEEMRLVLPNGTMIMTESVTWTCNRCGTEGTSEMPTCEVVQLPVVTCPQFEETEGITVKYTDERRVHSTATFSCTAPFILHGPSTLHCQQTGIWDRIQPTCRKPKALCPHIRETDVFSVQFTNGRKINSTAHFGCKDANLKIVGGLDTRTCLPSGQWSGANPNCKAPGCLMEDLGETVPINMVPSMEGVTENLQPVGSELAMHCEEGWVLIEGKMATCGPLGKWNFGKARCVVGCQLNIKDKSAALIIKPYKDYYRFGESVTVSCLKGFEPTSDVERVLCIEKGWSDTIPNCKEKTNK